MDKRVIVAPLGTGSRISDLKYKLMTIELLNLAKNFMPTVDRALYVNRTLEKIMRLESEIQQRLEYDEAGAKLNSETLLLERAVEHAVNAFAGTRITKILTPAVDSVPLATLLAHRLGVKLIIAKKAEDVGISEFIEETYIPKRTAILVSVCVPRDAIKRGDRVLIVNNVIDTGETQMSLARIVQRAKAEVIGIYSLIGIGIEGKTKLQQSLHCPTEIIYQIGEKPLQSSPAGG